MEDQLTLVLLSAIFIISIFLFVSKLRSGTENKSELALSIGLAILTAYFGYIEAKDAMETKNAIFGFANDFRLERTLNEPNVTIQQVIHFLKAEDYGSAKNLLSSLPDTIPEYLLKCGMRWREFEVYDHAKIYFDLYQLSDGKNPMAYYEYGKMIHEENPNEEENIIKLYEKAISLKKSFVPAYIALAEIYSENGQSVKALSYYEDALKHNEKCKEALERLGNIYFLNNQYNEAGKYFERLINLTPNDPENSEYYATLSSCHFNLENYQRAKELIDEAIRLEPDNITFLQKKIDVLPFWIAIDDSSSNENKGTISEDKVSESNVSEDITIDEIDSLLVEEPVQEEKEQKNKRTKITIFNASNRRKAANNLGYFLNREYGISYSRRTSYDKVYQTVIYYKNDEMKQLAIKLAARFPRTQRVGRITKKVIQNLARVRIQTYNDIVIYLGNDCANVGSWAY